MKPGEVESIKQAAEAADILVLGSFQWTGAQNSSQRSVIRSLLNSGKPAVVLSLMSPYDLPAYSRADCEIALYGMTAPSMSAAGEALSGTLAPSGRLPVDMPDSR